MGNTLNEAQDLLHCVKRESQTIGLFLYSAKTKVMHLNATSDDSLYALGGSRKLMSSYTLEAIPTQSMM